MEAISYKLDVFEGPLDLLLHLISKHKIDINDIPILLLVEQYLDYVRQMKEENMEVASEFLEMAARLIYIKTVSLLPVHEEEADELKRSFRVSCSNIMTVRSWQKNSPLRQTVSINTRESLRNFLRT